MNLAKRNEEILATLDQASPMLRSMAFQTGYDYDELYQRAALAALEHYEKALLTENPRAFLYGVMRNVTWQLSAPVQMVSLDRKVAAESDTTYADLLPAPLPAPVDERHEAKRTRALYASLRRLPLEVQLYLCRVHNLNAYRPARARKGRFAGKRQNVPCDASTLSRQAYAWLRRDRRLRAAICGERADLDFSRDFTLWQ